MSDCGFLIADCWFGRLSSPANQQSAISNKKVPR